LIRPHFTQDMSFPIPNAAGLSMNRTQACVLTFHRFFFMDS